MFIMSIGEIMNVEEMVRILSVNNISYIKKDANTYQEMHGYNEDYYELKIGHNDATVYYQVKE